MPHGGGSGGVQVVDAGLQVRGVPPFDVLQGLLQEARVFGVQAEHFLRQVLHGDGLHGEGEAFLAVFVREADHQALAGGELDVPAVPGDRVGAVDPDGAGHADHGLGADVRAGDDGGVPPFGILDRIAGDGPDARVRAGQLLAVVDLFRFAGPDRQRGAVDLQGTGDLDDIGEVGGDVLALVVQDFIGGDDVVRGAGIRDLALAGDLNGAVLRQAGDQRAAGAAQGLAVIELAGGLGRQLHRVGPDPVLVGGMRVVEGISAAFTAAGRGQQRQAVRDGLQDAVPEAFVVVDHPLDEALRVRGGHLVHGEGNAGAVARVGGGEDLAGGDGEDPVAAGGVGGVHRSGAFHDAEGGHGGDSREIGRGLLREEQRAADAHGHRGGLDVKGGVLVQLLLHVDEDLSLQEVQQHVLLLLDEFHLRGFIQGDDLVVVQADGGRGPFAGDHGLAAGEADVLHDEAGNARQVQDLYVPVKAQQAHRRGVKAFLRGSRQCQGKHQQEDDQQGRKDSAFHLSALLTYGRPVLQDRRLHFRVIFGWK